MNLYAIRRRDYWGSAEALQQTGARSAQVGEEMADDVRWIRTYVVQEESGRLGTVCIYEGTSAEKVREQAERTGMPADEVMLVADLRRTGGGLLQGLGATPVVAAADRVEVHGCSPRDGGSNVTRPGYEAPAGGTAAEVPYFAPAVAVFGAARLP